MTAPRSLGYRRARDLLLVSGLVVVGLVAGTMILRGVDPVEVLATLFFAPVFVGFLFWGAGAGIALAVAASAAYLALRIPAFRLVGFAPLSGLVLSRVVGYVAFGGIGGWAATRLRASLDKLELYDAVDDDTGLGNARSLLDVVARERGRTDRYGGVFSVVVARFELAPAGGAARRRTRNALRRLGARLDASVRGSDHVAHVADGTRHLVVVVLPETGPDGATVVAANLGPRITEELSLPVEARALSHPEQADAIDALVDEVRTIDAHQRPLKEPSAG